MENEEMLDGNAREAATQEDRNSKEAREENGNKETINLDILSLSKYENMIKEKRKSVLVENSLLEDKAQEIVTKSVLKNELTMQKLLREEEENARQAAKLALLEKKNH
jgi:hypothetical protein